MALLESQANPGVVGEIDWLHRALRTALRPIDHTGLLGQKILGHYSVFAQVAAIAPAANAVLGAFRFADPTNFAIITRVYTCVTVATAVTAQRTDPLVLQQARGYTVRDLTNATAIVVAAQNARKNMGTSLLAVAAGGNIDVASAAAGLTGGTKTVDANACGAAAFGAGGAIAALGTGMPVTDLYNLLTSSRHPIVMAAQEGALLTWGPTALATGTVVVGFGVDWAEVVGY